MGFVHKHLGSYRGATGVVRGTVALLLAGVVPAAARAQAGAATAASPALVFDHVTVVDVARGKLVPAQRVVIVGHRIQAMGGVGAVKLPQGAQVVEARGKYLIPGLWDMHVHTTADLPYQLLIANGVTGMRDAWAMVPLDTMRRWRREILTGTRVGPPRQILVGVALKQGSQSDCEQTNASEAVKILHTRYGFRGDECVIEDDTADVRRVVTMLKTAGADMLKMYALSPTMYFSVAAAARRAGIPFGGHIYTYDLSAIEASDSGARLIDHFLNGFPFCWAGRRPPATFWGNAPPVNFEQCQRTAERLRRNGTWWVPTMIASLANRAADSSILKHFDKRVAEFWNGALLHGNWLRDTTRSPVPDSLRGLRFMQRVGMPIVAGTDTDVGPGDNVGFWERPPGFALHAELAIMVAEGLTPLNALQSATLNPAQMLHATDSLGTVAPGKLADLVLLDANPLADITNTTTIHAVVANGRYFDRAALDGLLTTIQAAAQSGIPAWTFTATEPAVVVPMTIEAWKKSRTTAPPSH